MLQPIECFVLNCDNCNEIYIDEHDSGFSIFSDGADAQQKADDDGWYEAEDGKHYCPKCHKIDDDDNLIILPQILQK